MSELLVNPKSEGALKTGAMVIRAINHPLRQIMVQTISDGQNKLTVTEIYIKLRLEQSVASQHLAILRKAGFVNANRDGKHIHYSVNYERLKDVIQICEQLKK